MSFLKCAGIIDNEYFYASKSGFFFPNSTDPALKNATINLPEGFIFDRGCVYDGYNSTYVLGTTNQSAISYRVSALNNKTIALDENSEISFTYTPDLSHEVIFIANGSDWCTLYTSNDTNAINTVWEDCVEGNTVQNITQTSQITSLSNWIAGSNSNLLYQLTRTSLSLYDASNTTITLQKYYKLSPELALTQASTWDFAVAGYSKSFEFAVTNGTVVQTVSIPYNAQNGTSATVNFINSTGVQPNSAFVFSNDQETTLQSVSEDGVKQLAVLSQSSATPTHTTSSPDPSSTEPPGPKLNQNQIIGISVGVPVFVLLVLALLTYFICYRKKRSRGRSIATTSTGPIMRENDFINKYDTGSARPGVLNNIQEGDPDFTESSNIFNKSCFIPTNEVGDELPEGGIFLRKCEYKASRKKKPAMIHYFNSQHKQQFDKILMVLRRLNGQSNRILQLYKAFELESPSPRHQIKYILITSGYEPKNNLRTLYAKEGDYHNYIDLSDDVFKVWMVYSILTAVQALHHKDIIHNSISLKSFYAETNAPTMDWTLGDFYHATTSINSLDNKTDAKDNDILGVGRMIYDIVFEKIPLEHEHNYDNIQFDSSEIKGAYKEQFAYLLEHTFYPDPSKQTNADELLRYWERHFKF